MATPIIEIKNLAAEIDGNSILQDVNLTIHPGEIHAIMGPNGAGKSTLAKVLAGHPSYEVTKGEVHFRGKNLLELSPSERSHLGLFMSFQYPLEIAGVTNFRFLETAYNAHLKAKGLKEVTKPEFEKFLEERMEMMEIRPEFLKRSLNEGFSGGEKKRNEILQMSILEPYLAILDETDSGLDIDAMRIVACGVKKLMSPERSLVLITHYQRLLNYIQPQFVHVMLDGKIVESGGPELALTLEERGYDWLEKGEEVAE
ncbi:Fe-S cluster assembly ATPase SufC [Criblamydia sequanensis]|uniref:FeS assembly ATPase SufC n=1 Tax=Candidatus Criblamydia sequanensis CRIB-18 TaxID=1437425 RepID=A0A090E1B2_9BACT|nr:Fe-S cluster assembly ATPase SufC [Criblamydia sequanensis]CDR34554.1 FeS assembly ATPase SufC [Criblamydia sequanensis CRIB-18]